MLTVVVRMCCVYVVMNMKDDLMMMMCDVCSAGDTRQTPRHRALASVSGPHSSLSPGWPGPVCVCHCFDLWFPRSSSALLLGITDMLAQYPGIKTIYELSITALTPRIKHIRPLPPPHVNSLFNLPIKRQKEEFQGVIRRKLIIWCK